MAGTTINTLSEILREHYMGDPIVAVRKIEWWSCSKHKKPNLDHYDELCQYEKLTGEPCPDEYECPHVVSVKTRDGCSECKTSEWIQCLDGETGELAHEAYLTRTLMYELSRPSILFERLMKEGDGDSRGDR